MATTTIGSPGVIFPDASVQASATQGSVLVTSYTSPAPYSKPTGLKFIKVTVVGSGGNGGPVAGAIGAKAGGGGGGGGIAIGTFPAALVPATPFTIAVGGPGTPSSFTTLISATCGSSAATVTFPATTGSGGLGGGGYTFPTPTAPVQINMFGIAGNTSSATAAGFGGVCNLFLGAPGTGATAPGGGAGGAGGGVGAGGGGAQTNGSGSLSGGAGSPGFVLLEEYF